MRSESHSEFHDEPLCGTGASYSYPDPYPDPGLAQPLAPDGAGGDSGLSHPWGPASGCISGLHGALFGVAGLSGLDGTLFDATDDVAGLAGGSWANSCSLCSESHGLGDALVRSAALVVDHCAHGSRPRVCDCDVPILSLATSAKSARTSCISRTATVTGAASAKLTTETIRRILEVVSYQRIFWEYATWRFTLEVKVRLSQ